MTNKVELTPEQKDELVAFFQNNDFTANMALNREYNFGGERAEVFARTKKIFGEYWLGNLKRKIFTLGFFPSNGVISMKQIYTATTATYA